MSARLFGGRIGLISSRLIPAASGASGQIGNPVLGKITRFDLEIRLAVTGGDGQCLGGEPLAPDLMTVTDRLPRGSPTLPTPRLMIRSGCAV